MDWDPPAERGKPRANLRKVWNSIFYILTKGCRWADLPNDRDIYAARATAHQWMLQWQNEGVFDRVLSGLLQLAAKQKKIDLTHILVDGSFPPAPGGGAEVQHGYKGKGSLLHLLTDYNGNPLAITTTAANGNERQEVQKLIDRSVKKLTQKLCKRNMIILEADKGYDSGKIRQMLLNQEIFPFIPRRRIEAKSVDRPDQNQVGDYFNIKSVRWRVERTFSWLKRKCRRLLLRWKRLPKAWNAFATLSLTCYWKEILFR